jgi:hypothetical protein
MYILQRIVWIGINIKTVDNNTSYSDDCTNKIWPVHFFPIVVDIYS